MYKSTIVICTHNRANLLLKTIQSINSASCLAGNDISLLVIANACTDDTVQRLKEVQKTGLNLPFSFAEEPTPGKSFALIRAIKLINDGFIFFVDDDHRVDKNYFSETFKAIKAYPHIAIFCGQIIPDWTGLEPEWIHEQGPYKIYPLPVPHFELGNQPIPVKQGMKLPGGGNLIANRDVFTKVGHFSTQLGPVGHNLSGSEDSDFILRALKQGIKIQYVPDIIQYHYVDEERLKFTYLVRKSYQRTKSLIKAEFQNPQPIPLYLWRKLLVYISHLVFAFNMIKIRFYAMRVAATLGEIIGLKENMANH